MALRKFVPTIPWNKHGLRKALSIFLSNDHRVSSSTLLLSSNLLVPISAVHRNSLCLYWSPILWRFQTSTNCIPKSYPSIKAVNIAQILEMIFFTFDEYHLTPEVIEDILGMDEGELKPVLRGLSPLMDENEERLNRGLDIIPHFAHASFSDYLFDSSRSGPCYVNRQEYKKIRSLYGVLHSLCNWFGLGGKRSYDLQPINHDRISSITRVLHTKIWDYFTSRLPHHFDRSPEEVKEAIMTDIDDLVQDFWRTSSDVDVGASFFAMRRLFEILQMCLKVLDGGLDVMVFPFVLLLST